MPRPSSPRIMGTLEQTNALNFISDRFPPSLSGAPINWEDRLGKSSLSLSPLSGSIALGRQGEGFELAGCNCRSGAPFVKDTNAKKEIEKILHIEIISKQFHDE